MFVLPKLHKQGHPLRPVVSTCLSILQPVAHVVDLLLKPIIQSYKRYIKDSGHVLLKMQDWAKKLEEQGVPWKNVFLVSFDIVAFYPSVGHNLAMRAWEKWSRDLPIACRVVDALTVLLQFQLDNSYFEFESRYYKQLAGLPIGSPLGGPLACLSAMYLETEHLASVPSHLAFIEDTYARYLDDSLAVITAETPEEAQQKATEFLGILNSMDQNLQFTSTGASKSLSVLDIQVMVNDGGFHTTRYKKPTDKRVLLAADSNHPRHVKCAIPLNSGLRLRKLCSNNIVFWTELIDEARILLAKGFSDEMIARGFARAIVSDRASLLKPHVPCGWITEEAHFEEGVLNFVSTFDKDVKIGAAMVTVREKLRHLSQVFPASSSAKLKIRTAFRKGPNLHSMLVKNRPQKDQLATKGPNRVRPSAEQATSGYTTCNCTICSMIKNYVKQDVVREYPSCFKFPGVVGQVVPKSTCLTRNCIYTVQCLSCAEYYIGETKRAFRVRALEHMPALGDERKVFENLSGVRMHNLRSHNGAACFLPMIVQVLHPDTSNFKRKAVEKKFIDIYKPGINILHSTVLREKMALNLTVLPVAGVCSRRSPSSPNGVTIKRVHGAPSSMTVRRAPTGPVVNVNPEVPVFPVNHSRASDTIHKTVCKELPSSTSSPAITSSPASNQVSSTVPTPAGRRDRIRCRRSSPHTMTMPGSQ
jgi:peptide-methionine (R)-S-oxide reductase